jgi:hypothetical protein
MKILLLLLALAGLSCQISPVITPTEEGGSERYDDCRRAAKDYCRDVLGVAKEDTKECVSKATFECISGSR